jgi:hypothetical protein
MARDLDDPEDPGPARPARRWRRPVVLTGGVVLLIAIASGAALLRSDDDPPPDELTVGWGGSEGHPSCGYDAATGTVTATLTVDGTAPPPDEVTATVTAYADENTSQPVGSSSRTVRVDGTVHLTVLVTIAVDGAPHIDEDGETACSLSVT